MHRSVVNVRLAVAAMLAGAALLVVYLAVWERRVAGTDDPSLEDSALGGPDTTPRG